MTMEGLAAPHGQRVGPDPAVSRARRGSVAAVHLAVRIAVSGVDLAGPVRVRIRGAGLEGAQASRDRVVGRGRGVAVVRADDARRIGVEDVAVERPLARRVPGRLAPADGGVGADQPQRDVRARRVDVRQHAGRDRLLAVGVAGAVLVLRRQADAAREGVVVVVLIRLDQGVAGGQRAAHQVGDGLAAVGGGHQPVVGGQAVVRGEAVEDVEAVVGIEAVVRREAVDARQSVHGAEGVVGRLRSRGGDVVGLTPKNRGQGQGCSDPSRSLQHLRVHGHTHIKQ